MNPWDRVKALWEKWTPEEAARELEPMQSHTVQTHYPLGLQHTGLKKGERAKIEAACAFPVSPRRLIVPNMIARHYAIESLSFLLQNGKREEQFPSTVPAEVFSELALDSYFPIPAFPTIAVALGIRCVKARPWAEGRVRLFDKTFSWAWGDTWGRAPDFSAVLLTMKEETRAGPPPRCIECGSYPCECEPPDSRDE